MEKMHKHGKNILFLLKILLKNTKNKINAKKE
jgi:hypothetical protein